MRESYTEYKEYKAKLQYNITAYGGQAHSSYIMSQELTWKTL